MAYSIVGAIFIAYFCIILCWIFGCLRYYTRLFVVKSFWVDDALSIIALVRGLSDSSASQR